MQIFAVILIFVLFLTWVSLCSLASLELTMSGLPSACPKARVTGMNHHTGLPYAKVYLFCCDGCWSRCVLLHVGNDPFKADEAAALQRTSPEAVGIARVTHGMR